MANIKTDDLMELGRRIRKKRKAVGFSSQEDFAYFLGIDRSHMGAIERGEINITFNTLSIICSGLKSDIAALTEDLPKKGPQRDRHD